MAAVQPRRPVIVMEFNELCPALLDQWMREGRLPNFKRLHDQCAVFTTDADVTDSGQLEPWIQWYSVHTGLAYRQHRVFHLTEGVQAGHRDIYRALLDNGRRVGSMASMNVAPFARKGSFFVGDPWSENGDASPPALNIYNRFVSHNVREYSNASNRMGLCDYFGFLHFMVAHGLSVSTIARILAQLAAEKVGDHRRSYKRVAILDRLQFDLFKNLYLRDRPDFATFFLNSTAHLQHSYWRHMDPDAFTVRPNAGETAVYGDAIRFGYEAMDGLVGKFLALADRTKAVPMMMTALSQQPFLRHEEQGGQHFYRLHNAEIFLRGLGVAYSDVDPTMTHQYLARFAGPAEVAAARARIEQLRLVGTDAGASILFGFASVDAGDDGLYFGCQISTQVSADAQIRDDATGEHFPFARLLYKIEAIKSGRHHPEGALWIGADRPCVHSDHASILDVFPTVLDMLGIAEPAEEREGRSLMPLLAA